MRNSKGQFKPKHGLYDHPFYGIWNAMINRCDNPKNAAYHNYGGRGIVVCEEWHDPAVFIEWLEANGYRKGLQIDRIDNDGNYEPSNCHLVSCQENMKNTRCNRRYLVHGEMLLGSEIEERYGIKATTFRARVIRYGQTPEQALQNRRKLPQSAWLIDGREMTSKAIEKEYGILANTFNSRVNRGWSATKAAKTPVGGYRH